MKERIGLMVVWVMLSVLVAGVVSCGRDDGPDTLLRKAARVPATDTLRVLSLGNSFSIDALAYVPYLMAELAPDMDFALCMACEAYCPLRKHLENAYGDIGYTMYFNNCGNPWEQHDNQPLSRILALTSWDVIIFQQVSYDSYNYATVQPYLNELIEWVGTKTKSSGTLAWLITPAYAQGSEPLAHYDFSSDEMAQKIGECAQRVIKETDVSLVIPCGTALQLARHTELDKYGSFGHLSVDGSHLQPGIACLTEAYVAAECLLRYCGRTSSVSLSLLTIDANWMYVNNIPQSWPVAGMSRANQVISKQCAQQAFHKPYYIAPL